MRWRIMLELAGPDGTLRMHEVGAGERSPTGHTVATLVRWRLWHRQVRRALDLIGATLAWLEGKAQTAPAAAAKVMARLRGLETYVSGQAELIIPRSRPGDHQQTGQHSNHSTL